MRGHITSSGKFVRPERKAGQSFEDWERELVRVITAKRKMWRWWRKVRK